jgi:cytochrome P450
VARSFTPRAVARLGGLFETEAHRAVDRIVRRGRADLTADVCRVLPVEVTAEFVGLPRADGPMVLRWIQDWFELFRTPHPPGEQLRLAAGFEAYLGYVGRLIARRRADPREDFVSQAATGLDAVGAAIGEAELVELVASILLGGTDTVANLLGNALHRLLADRTVWRRVVDDPAAVLAAVEEVLRYDGASLGDYRFTTRPVVVAGVEIPAGRRVLTLRDSANHDETVFPDPERFDIDRPNVRSHLAFGHGVHHCVGAALARAETVAAVTVLAARLPSLRLLPGAPLRYRRAVLSRGLLARRVGRARLTVTRSRGASGRPRPRAAAGWRR